ncbi:MAG: hypothetical protein F3745_08680 [Nitrospinae bacterium]|nr:hypothetical protein [Nitrospinota bacterium]
MKIDTEGTDISILLNFIQKTSLDICFLIFEANDDQFRELNEGQTQALLSFASKYQAKVIYGYKTHGIEFTVENVLSEFEF